MTVRPSISTSKAWHLEDTPRIHYWRKHPNLHGWMAGRYYEKGGTDDDFNVNTVELTPEDIDELERTILENRFRYVRLFLRRNDRRGTR
jgi:hypothetical protein